MTNLALTWDDVLPPNPQLELQRQVLQIYQDRQSELELVRERIQRAVHVTEATGVDVESNLWAIYHALGSTPILTLGDRWGLVVYAVNQGDAHSLSCASRITAEAGAALGRNPTTHVLVTASWIALRVERGRYLVAHPTTDMMNTLLSLHMIATSISQSKGLLHVIDG